MPATDINQAVPTIPTIPSIPHIPAMQYNQVDSKVGLRDAVFFKMASVPFFHKLLRIALYQSDFGSASIVGFGKDSDITALFRTFMESIAKEVRNRNNLAVSKKQILSLIDLSKQILNLKVDIASRLITYDNVFEQFSNIDPFSMSLLKKVSADRISTVEVFQKEIDDLIYTVQIYNEMLTLDNVLVSIDHLRNMATSEDFSILNVAQEYKATVLDAYDTLSTLKTVATEDMLSDYLVFKDNDSVRKAVEDITQFLTTSYNHYDTGYTLFDENVDGLETSSVHIIAGPSNHAKSIFMLNITKGLIMKNLNTFTNNDAIIFITLEDDIHKLLRRIISVFGNYDTRIVKRLFQVLSTYFQNQNERDKINMNSTGLGIDLLNQIISDAIVTITGSKVSFIIKHCNENSFSMRDGTRFLDKLKLQGLSPKALFIDYLDVMKSSSSKYDSYKDDYNLHGEILQEMRTAARNYAIPIVTITQNSRISENVQQELSNSVIGDSYKKVRYADYIYMIRQRPDIDIISDQIKGDIGGDSTLLNLSSDLSRLVPFEVKITKAKDGNRDAKKIHIFSKQTLGIYDTYERLVKDASESQTKTASLQTSLGALEGGMGIEIDSEFLVEANTPALELDSLIL